MGAHWHAYTWSGRERPGAPDIYSREASAPPAEVENWLLKPARMIVATFHEIGEAAVWLEKQLADTPPLASYTPEGEWGGPPRWVEYARATLAQEAGADVVWGYYAPGDRFVYRAVIRCPRGPKTPAGQPFACPMGL